MTPKGFLRMLEILLDEECCTVDGVAHVPLDPVLQLLARFTDPSPVVWLNTEGEVRVAWPMTSLREH